MTSPADAAREDLRPFLVRTVIVVGVVLSAIVLVGGLILLADIALLTFGAILVATTLRHGGAWVARWTPLSPFWGFVTLTATILLAAMLLGVFAGPAIVTQAQEFAPEFMEQVGHLRARVEQVHWARPIVQKLATGDIEASRILSGGFVSSAIGSLFSTANGILIAILVVFGAGVFMGFDPQAYREPVVRLFPPNRRDRIRETLDDTGQVLARWFVGRLMTMIFNGGVVALTLWYLGVPMPWLLGLITGIFTFVPMLGSWLAIVPAVIFAAPQGIDAMITIVVAYTITQQIENLVVEPLVMQQAIKMPPAYVLLSQLALGALTGAAGVAFAVPLLAAVTVIVRRLYVEDILGELRADDAVERTQDGEPRRSHDERSSESSAAKEADEA
jgi:predicted PurR-regulated permease PerM